MLKKTDRKGPVSKKENENSKNVVLNGALDDKELDNVSGGESAFDDVPRVPSNDYDGVIKDKV